MCVYCSEWVRHQYTRMKLEYRKFGELILNLNSCAFITSLTQILDRPSTHKCAVVERNIKVAFLGDFRTMVSLRMFPSSPYSTHSSHMTVQ